MKMELYLRSSLAIATAALVACLHSFGERSPPKSSSVSPICDYWMTEPLAQQAGMADKYGRAFPPD
jgi:hypothetical protein